GWPYDGDAVRVLRERLPGGRLALDDVGTGWADLARIVAIRPDYIKLALPLVRGIHQDPAREAAVWAIAESAKRIGAQVIAEGVEQPQEPRFLESLGIRLAQGFLFGRSVPLPLDYHNA
ncbi:MAG TPA: EAL domain-containing protein, partial [Calditerricola sp.]